MEIDDFGIDRYAEKGETSYLNSYRIHVGAYPLGTDVLEYQFGSIWRNHGVGIIDAALECDGVLEPRYAEGSPNGKLRHFRLAADKDDAGFSYCAFADLFGGNGFLVHDVFLELRE